MKTSLRPIIGNWNLGYALDKHVLRSVYTGDNQFGHPQFETTRSDPGEALFQLKYRRNWAQAKLLAEAVVSTIFPRLAKVDLIVPVPPSNMRAWQPVSEVAKAMGEIAGIPVFENIVVKAPAVGPQKPLKDMNSKEEKAAALAGRLVLNDGIKDAGCWDAVLLDDLFDTGASMEAACAVLRGYRKIGRIYAVALTWK